MEPGRYRFMSRSRLSADFRIALFLKREADDEIKRMDFKESKEKEPGQ